MPYFVYKIVQPLQLDHLSTVDKYQEARAMVRELREAASAESSEDIQYRLIFAKHQAEAEKLLSTPRDERVIGED